LAFFFLCVDQFVVWVLLDWVGPQPLSELLYGAAVGFCCHLRFGYFYGL
jgi:hypothetical protein